MLQDLTFSIHADQKTAAAFGRVRTDLRRLKTDLGSVQTEMRQTGRMAVSAADSVADLGNSTGRLSRLSPAASNNLRNLSYQFNQIGQQGAATGNYLQALSIQIPDILASFGSFPLVIAGGAIALGASLVPALISGAEAAQSFDKAMEDLEDQLSASQEVIDLISNDFSGLREQLAGSREAISLLGQSIAEISLRDLRAEADDLVRSLTKMYDGFLGSSRREDLRAEFMEFGAGVNDLAAAAERLQKAGTLREQLASAVRLRELFLDLAGPVQDMTEEQIEYYTAMVDTENMLRRVLKATQDQEAALEDAADAADSINDPFASIIKNLMTAKKGAQAFGEELLKAAQLQSMSMSNRGDFLGSELTYSGRGSGLYEMGYAPSYDSPDLADLYEPSSGGSSSGGSSEVDDLARSYERLRSQLDPAYKAMQDMADARMALNWALREGKINEEEHIELLARARQEYMDTGEALADYAQEVGDFFGDFLVDFYQGLRDGEDAWESFKNAAVSALDTIAETALRMAANAAVQMVLGSMFGGGTGLTGGLGAGLFGGGLGGALLDFEGGGYTGSGPRAGGLDGKGGILAMVHPNETIVDHTKGGGAGAVEIHISGNLPDGTVTRRPGRVDIDLSRMVAEQIASGAADRAIQQRFGLGPRGIGG